MTAYDPFLVLSSAIAVLTSVFSFTTVVSLYTVLRVLIGVIVPLQE